MFLRGLVSLYSWNLPRALAERLDSVQGVPSQYLSWFWQARQFSPTGKPLSLKAKLFCWFVGLGMLAQISWGVWLLINWARFGSAGSWQFGLSLIVSYPIVWANFLALVAAMAWVIYFVLHPKQFGRAVVCAVLERQVRRLRKRHQITVVAVVGSVGKTSTKLAIADLLAQKLRVRHQVGNYNDRVTVPLIFFGHNQPDILNFIAWLKIFRANKRAIRRPYPYDVVVVELGTDGPGQLAQFSYVKPELAVISSIAPEHMEYFGTLDAVAAEELAVFDFAQQVLVNGDDTPGEYLAGREFIEYSTLSERASYYTKPTSENLDGQSLDITLPKGRVKAAHVQYIGWHGAKFALAAAAVADILGMKPADIKDGLQHLRHFSGRMQVLSGIKNSKLIDDTYNASPIAVKAALDVLYATKTSQRIAILGSMNELGDYSRQAHREVGEYCDGKKLKWIVTIGSDAKKWLAPAAKRRGCKVKSFMSPYEAGEFVAKELKKNAVVLAKGSQNGVFSEEALKVLLADPKDAEKLVRQSSYWLKKKQKQFLHH